MRRMGPIGRRAGWLALPLILGLLGMTSSAALAQDEDSTPWLGVTTQSLDDGLRDGMDYNGDGVVVTGVLRNTGAERAGIRKGDVIISINGRSVSTPSELARVIRAGRIGQTVSVAIMRDGQRRTISARLGTRGDEGMVDEDMTAPEANRMRDEIRRQVRDQVRDDIRDRVRDDRDKIHDEMDMDELRDLKDLKDLGDLKDLKDLKVRLKDMDGFQHFDMGDGTSGFMYSTGRGRLGIRLQDMSKDLAEYFEIPNGEGALVTEVLDNTPAERVGLRAGDVIVDIEGKRISNAQDVTDAIRQAPGGKVSITVMRKGSRRSFEPELERRESTTWSDDGRNYMMTPRARTYTFRRGDGGGMTMIRPIPPTPPVPPVAPRVMPRSSDATREEVRQLREEIRQLRDKLDRLENR